MIHALLVIVASQLLLAVLLFGTDRLERASRRHALVQIHPFVPRRLRHRSENARVVAARQRRLERLGVATRRAAVHH